MTQYTLLVVHWSIFTLSVQLIYCASLHSTHDSVQTSAGGVGLSSITVPPTNYKSSQTVTRQSICYAETEHSLSLNGKESSIILDLEPNRIQMGPCKRTFIAPEPHGFIVKLLKFKSKQMRNPNSHIDSNTEGVSVDLYNETATCPLNIMAGKDALTPPWKLDPCNETVSNFTETVRLTEGLLRISWTPNHHSPKYKLIITTLGKGYYCNQGKHPCLKLGQETLLCVSSSLTCDGIKHCPSGDEYSSDEDAALCANRRGPSDTNPSFGLSIWQQISKEFFNKLYPADSENTAVSSMPSKSPAKSLVEVSAHKKNEDSYEDSLNSSEDSSVDDSSTESTTKHYQHITFSRGLSKYGPWSYLILGMLLCGGALLVCVLWGSSTNSNFNTSQAEPTLPPSYDDTHDPPPSYATLFPNNKALDSSATESSSSAIESQSANQSAPSPDASQTSVVNTLNA